MSVNNMLLEKYAMDIFEATSGEDGSLRKDAIAHGCDPIKDYNAFIAWELAHVKELAEQLADIEEEEIQELEGDVL